MKVDLSKVDEVIVRDSDGKVVVKFTPASINNLKSKTTGNIVMFTMPPKT